MKHSFSGTLLCSALLLSLISCGNNTAVDVPDNSAQTPETTAALTSDTQSTAVEDDIYTGLEAPNLNGYEFRIANNYSGFAYTTLDLEKETGEPLDDAIYRRNQEVEDLLNITISAEEMSYSDVSSTIQRLVLAGDNDYDVYYNETQILLNSGIYSKYLLDMKDVKTLHFDRPWWNMVAMDSVQIDDRLFYLFGDSNVMFWECYTAFMFNQKIAGSYDLPDLYSAVDDGKWTFDLMKTCIRTTAYDLNGNGAVDDADQFGCVFNGSGNMGFFVAAETPLITKNENGNPQWNGLTERMTNVYDKIVDCLYGLKDCICFLGCSFYEGSDANKLFFNGTSLFCFDPLGVSKYGRNSQFPIGLLPYPKYDEAQERYHTFIAHQAPACVVPQTIDDPETIGSILECLSAYSHKYVLPVYFDTTLDFKYAQDENSIRMLDIILNTGELDLSVIYNWGSLSTTTSNLLMRASDQWASKIAAKDKTIADKIAKSLES